MGLGQDLDITEQEAVLQLKAATERLREAQQSSFESREVMLADLSRKRAKEWRMEAESAIKIIKNAEKSKRKFSKISRRGRILFYHY